MAHMPPSTAIFSPSVARLAASNAKDWNYINSWLVAKYHGRTPPPFERNPDTLRALLALAALNETADEDRDLVARVEATALQELPAAGRNKETGEGGVESVRDSVLNAIEDSLSQEGRVALDAMASAAVALGIAFPEPEAIGRAMIELQAQVLDVEQARERVAVLERYVAAEAVKTQELLAELESEEYAPPAHLARDNLEMQRKLKAGALRLPELKDRAVALAASMGMPNPTIEQVREAEKEYLALLSQKKDLEAQVKSFQGLPPDKELARRELEALRDELLGITQRRDAVFEGLVERETPRKGR